MPNKKIEIACDEQGNYSVGEEASAMEGAPEGQEGTQMQPVKSLDEALMLAKQMFLQGSQEGQDQQAEQDFAKGFRGPQGAY